MLCLPNSEIDAAVLAEAGPHLGPGAIVVDTTTGEPEQMEALGRGLRERGVEYLDATVGGSSQQVRASQTIEVLAKLRKQRAKPKQERLKTFGKGTTPA